MKIFTCFFFVIIVLYYENNKCEANDLWDNSVRSTKGIEFLFVASISLKNYGDDPNVAVPICSGVLITKKHVMTLAHCMDEVNDLKDVRVRLGFRDLKYTAKYYIKAWTTYKLWAKENDITTEPFEHDISIIKLAEKVAWGISPATISKSPNEFFDGQKVKAVVWGPAKNDRAAMLLKVAELDVISNQDCIKQLNNSPLMLKNHTIDKTYMCTKLNLGAVLDEIDSGSPLVINKNELIAINDPTYLRRNDIHAPTSLNFHIGLDYYRSFIKNVTKSESAKWWQWKRN